MGRVGVPLSIETVPKRGNHSLVPFGYARSLPTSATLLDAKSQEGALKVLAELAQRATINPLIRNTTLKVIRNAGARDDEAELEAIFRAVKKGDQEVAPLVNGVKYVRDPTYADYFESPVDILNNCLRGACGSDCDGQTGLVVAMAGSIGFTMGLRAYGEEAGSYSHVYPVAAYPKTPPFKKVVGMDTTVPRSTLGWEPPEAFILTAWLI